MRNKPARLLSVICCLLLLVALPGCKKEEQVPVVTPPTQVKVPMQGETFLATGFKIRSVITPQATATLDPLTFEIYVDGSGAGTGLVGYKDDVYDVVISEDKVFVKVADNVAIRVTDVTGHMVTTDLDIVNSNSLKDLGFTMVDNRAGSFKATTDSFLIDTTFSVSESAFDKTTVASGNSMTITELINYILSTSVPGYTTGENQSEPIVPEKGSFWNNSWIGLTIHEKVYSIGDFCNPSTYFEELTPEGITPSYAYNGDNRVELRHINYQSSDGRSSFMTTEGYVQTITTSSDFKFLDVFYRGMEEAELKQLLGIGLKKKDMEEWKPVVEGMTAYKGKGKTYVAKYEDLTIEFTIAGSGKTLSEISITNYIDFLQ